LITTVTFPDGCLLYKLPSRYDPNWILSCNAYGMSSLFAVHRKQTRHKDVISLMMAVNPKHAAAN